MAPADFVTVASEDQIPEGTLKVFDVGEVRVAVSRVEGEFYAIEDLCTHDGGPLGEGTLQGDEVECPRHGARFSVVTGDALSMPAVTPVKVFRTRVKDGQVQVRVE